MWLLRSMRLFLRRASKGIFKSREVGLAHLQQSHQPPLQLLGVCRQVAEEGAAAGLLGGRVLVFEQPQVVDRLQVLVQLRQRRRRALWQRQTRSSTRPCHPSTDRLVLLFWILFVFEKIKKNERAKRNDWVIGRQKRMHAEKERQTKMGRR